jgi:hypothetical protein
MELCLARLEEISDRGMENREAQPLPALPARSSVRAATVPLHLLF